MKTLVWGGLDWMMILENLRDEHPEIITVKFYTAKYSGWKKLYPGTIDINMKEFEFTEMEEEGLHPILIQSLNNNTNIDIKSFIKQWQYTYVSNGQVKVLGWAAGGKK